MLEFNAYFESKKITGPCPNTWHNRSDRYFTVKSLNTSGDRTVLMGRIHFVQFSLAGKAVMFSVPFAEDQEL